MEANRVTADQPTVTERVGTQRQMGIIVERVSKRV